MSDPTLKVVSDGAAIVNGWTIYAHSIFFCQLEVLMGQVEILRQKDPTGYTKKNAVKRLAA